MVGPRTQKLSDWMFCWSNQRDLRWADQVNTRDTINAWMDRWIARGEHPQILGERLIVMHHSDGRWLFMVHPSLVQK